MRKISFCFIRVFLFASLPGAIFVTTPAPTPAQVAVGISVRIAPPALPVYEQPICPGDGYLWAPGYWAWDPDAGDYYWVPGTWVLAPQPGFFWTPGYWGWGGDGYFFTAGYWGPVVGFYGGISYGFGYFGHGFEGGRWENGHFFYNRAVSNVNVTVIHNTYSTVINRGVTVNRVSYNGGNGGITARATAEEEAAAHDRHMGPVAAQTQHVEEARANRELRASVNHGAPPVAATSKPGEFHGGGMVPAREAGAIHTQPGDGAARPEGNLARVDPAFHPNDLPKTERPPAPNTGDSKLDKKYQQQQDKLASQQEKERQMLQKQQDKGHQQLEKQKASGANVQQVEQKHQQQTQQLQMKHVQQMQNLQQHQQPPAPRPPHKS
jgi:WXXGXW repeat (2 copies)